MKLSPNKNARAARALWFAETEGAVFGGYNVTRKGSRFTVSASTLRACERRGYLTIGIGPDGGMMGQLTDAGRKYLSDSQGWEVFFR